MSKKENIDKQIYRLSQNIGKNYLPLYGGYACCLAGIIAFLIFKNLNPTAPQWLAELLVGIIAIGALSLLTVLCYYLFGDCCRPYYKPDYCPIERDELFFDADSRGRVIRMVCDGEVESLKQVPTSTRADIVVVLYSDVNQKIIAMQAFYNEAGRLTPATSIYYNEKI